MLETFYKDPLLQEVKSITVQPLRQGRGNRFQPIDEAGGDQSAAPEQPMGPGGFPGGFLGPGGFRGFPSRGGTTDRTGGIPTAFEVTMTVEALMLNGAEMRNSLLPDVPSGKLLSPLADPGRHYPEILVKNPFGNPPPGTSTDGPRETPEEALSYVKLTMLYHDGRRWQATFYNQSMGPPENRVNALTLDAFRVFDRYDNIAFESKVKLVDDKQIVLEAQGKYYRLFVGDMLYKSLEKPLTDGELEKLGIKKKSVAEAPAKTAAASANEVR